MVSQAASSEKARIKLTSKQLEAWRALAVSEDTELMFGGAKGGGKSLFGCVWCYMMALDIIKKLGIKKRKYPVSVGFMGRKVGKIFRETTLETWKRVIPQSDYEIRDNGSEIVILGAVKIEIGGLDHTETVNKFNSSELFFFFIDQAEETTQQDIAVLRGAMRAKYKDTHLAYKGLFTANPAQCWLKSEFIDNPQPNRKFVQALPSDNPHLPDSYTKTLTDAFGFRPELLAAYLHGDWNAVDMANQIIRGTWISAAKARALQVVDHPRKFIAVDTARFGDDESVVLLMQESLIRDHRVLPFCSTTQLSFEIFRLSQDNGNLPIVIETTGADIGAGVSDELRQMGAEVLNYVPQGKAQQEEKYYNQRAEAWWLAAKAFSDNRVQMDRNYDPAFMQRLESQLCVPTYEFRNGKILVEAKEDIKKRMGCSPDRADAYVIGLWALERLGIASPTEKHTPRYSRERIMRVAV